MTSSSADNMPDVEIGTSDKSVDPHSTAGSGSDARTPSDAVSGSQSRRYYSIGELAAAFGVTTRAIRFYEAKQLISPERRGTARLYSRRDRARLQMILRGKNVGFSLEEIREFLDLYDADPSMTMQTRHLLGKVEVAITELECKRADIDRTLSELDQIRRECIEHLEGET